MYAQYGGYCDFQRDSNGNCLVEAMEENEKKIKEAKEKWLATRGCKLEYTQFGRTISQLYQPCPRQFNEIGDIRDVDREDQSGNTTEISMKLLSWYPEKPAAVPGVFFLS
jgi:hypothetical protein